MRDYDDFPHSDFSISGVNGNCGTCGPSVPIATNGEPSSNGSSYDNTFLSHDNPVAPDHSEGHESSQVGFSYHYCILDRVLTVVLL